MICHYCNGPVKCVMGGVIYPRRPDLWKKNFWLCKPCEAWVGCHPNTKKPLGIVANAELRKLKSEVHANFDPLWKDGRMSRKEAYAWLSHVLAIPIEETHVGMFTNELCERAIYELEMRRGPYE